MNEHELDSERKLQNFFAPKKGERRLHLGEKSKKSKKRVSFDPLNERS